MPDLVASPATLVSQASPVSFSHKLVGKTGTVVFGPLETKTGKLLDEFNTVSISGPYLIEVDALTAADRSYSGYFAIIPAKYRTDHPKTAELCGDLPGKSQFVSTGTAAPVATSVVFHHTITQQLKPPVLGAHQPLFLIFWRSEGTDATSEAIVRIRCLAECSGMDFPKFW